MKPFVWCSYSAEIPDPASPPFHGRVPGTISSVEKPSMECCAGTFLSCRFRYTSSAILSIDVAGTPTLYVPTSDLGFSFSVSVISRLNHDPEKIRGSFRLSLHATTWSQFRSLDPVTERFPRYNGFRRRNPRVTAVLSRVDNESPDDDITY